MQNTTKAILLNQSVVYKPNLQPVLIDGLFCECVMSNELAVVYRKTTDLIPYVNNSRTHSDEQVTQIASSINEWGFTNPLLIDEQGGIIAGHGRLMAANKLGLEQVPTITLIGLSEAQRKAYVIADNKLAENSEFDLGILALEIERLKELDFDIDLLGFDEDELADLLPEIEVLPDGDEDAVPELQDDPVSKLGDIWQLGSHRLMNGDSTSIDAVEKLMDGQKADMVFTDPPYGIDYSGGRTQVVATKQHGKIKNDTLAGEDLGGLISQIFNFTKEEADTYICVSPIMQKPFLDFIEASGRKVDAVIVWDKKQPGLGYMAYRRQCEFILFSKGGKFKKGDKSDFDLWSISRDSGKDYVHGTQKPVAVPERGILNSSKKDDIVLELFGGSGSTLIACEKNSRHCRAMELDEQYVDVIIKRFQDYTGKQAVHIDSGKTYDELAGDSNAAITD